MSFGKTGIKFIVPLIGIEQGRKLAAMSLRIRSEELELVAAALRSMSKYGVRTLGFSCSANGDEYVCVGLGDYTNASKTPSEVASELSRMPGVTNVEVHEGPVTGFAAVRGLVLEAAEARAILMSARALAGLLQGPREYLGDDAGAAFVYYEGFFTGRAMGEYLSQFGREDALAMFPRILEARGYGTPIEVLRDPNDGHYRFEVGRLVECEILSRYASGRRTSHFFRGIIAGVLSTIEGGNWNVEEVECINAGSDKCAFEARRGGAGQPSK